MNDKIESGYTLVYKGGVQSCYVETDKELEAFIFKGYLVNVEALSPRQVTFDKAKQLAGQCYIGGINCSLMPVTTLKDLMIESREINRILANFGKAIPGKSWGLTKPKVPSETDGVTHTCVVWTKDNPADVREYPANGTAPFVSVVREETHDEIF